MFSVEEYKTVYMRTLQDVDNTVTRSYNRKVSKLEREVNEYRCGIAYSQSNRNINEQKRVFGGYQFYQTHKQDNYGRGEWSNNNKGQQMNHLYGQDFNEYEDLRNNTGEGVPLEEEGPRRSERLRNHAQQPSYAQVTGNYHRNEYTRRMYR